MPEDRVLNSSSEEEESEEEEEEADDEVEVTARRTSGFRMVTQASSPAAQKQEVLQSIRDLGMEKQVSETVVTHVETKTLSPEEQDQLQQHKEIVAQQQTAKAQVANIAHLVAAQAAQKQSNGETPSDSQSQAEPSDEDIAKKEEQARAQAEHERLAAEARQAQARAQQEALQRAQQAQTQAQAQARAQQEALERAKQAQAEAQKQAQAKAQAQQQQPDSEADADKEAQVKAQKEAQAKAQKEAQQRAKEAQEKAQQEAQKRAKEAQLKAQQEAQKKAQEAQARAQEDAKRRAEQARALQESQRKAQQEAQARAKQQAQPKTAPRTQAQPVSAPAKKPQPQVPQQAQKAQQQSQQPQWRGAQKAQTQPQPSPVVQPKQSLGKTGAGKSPGQAKPQPAVPAKSAAAGGGPKVASRPQAQVPVGGGGKLAVGAGVQSQNKQQARFNTAPQQQQQPRASGPGGGSTAQSGTPQGVNQTPAAPRAINLIPNIGEQVHAVRGSDVQQAYLSKLERPAEQPPQESIQPIQAMDDACWLRQTRVSVSDIHAPQPARIAIPEMHGNADVKPTVIVPTPTQSTRVEWNEFPQEEQKEPGMVPRVKAQDWIPANQGEIVGAAPVKNVYQPGRIGRAWPPPHDENQAPMQGGFLRAKTAGDQAWIHEERGELEKGPAWGRVQAARTERAWPPPGNEVQSGGFAGARLPSVQWPPAESEMQIQQEVEVLQTRLPVKPNQRQWPPPPPQYQTAAPVKITTTTQQVTQQNPTQQQKTRVTTTKKQTVRA